ncbi:MAG: hypothetical protein NT075_35465 [Chloroflexi bacterium]|nr:hypothetical protein [Chloroflexota bacterium]
MPYLGHLQSIGILLLAGLVLFGGAAFAAEPFGHVGSASLYKAIHMHGARYRQVNLLATAGVIVLFSGFVLLARLTWRVNQPITVVGLALLGMATILWLLEVGLRITTTMATAQDVMRGVAPPARFPQTIGVGFEVLFIAFLVTALIGIAALLWGLGEAGVFSLDLTRAGVVILVASSVFAAREYPWVGAVERILFYPFVGVVLPLALLLLSRGA